MAHAIVEWTDNLRGQFDLRALLRLIATEMRAADGVFPWGGIRVRAIELTDYVIADDSGEDAFINITIKIGAGRSADVKQAFFSGLFVKLRASLSALFDTRFIALSMYVEEADESSSFKSNNIHRRFKGAV
jgi:5-carboxymethyl-2-hydroxymuconate isomerase